MWFPFSIVFHCVKNQLSNENQRSAMNGGDVYWEEKSKQEQPMGWHLSRVKKNQNSSYRGKFQ